MALGKIKADTLEHSTAGSLDTQYVVNGSAKAWLSMDSGGGSTTTFFGSLNTSSVTDTAVGKYDQNFTNSFSGATYSGVGIAQNNVNVITNVNNTAFGSYTAGASGIVLYNGAGSAYTDVDVSTAHLGDLA